MNWRIRCCSSLTRKDENERENKGTIVVVEVHLVIRIHRKRGTKRGRTRNWDFLDGKYKAAPESRVKSTVKNRGGHLRPCILIISLHVLSYFCMFWLTRRPFRCSMQSLFR